MAGESSSHLSSVSDTKLLFHFSLASASENSGLRASDFDDGLVFDMDPNLLVDLDKLIIGHMIGEGSHSIIYKGWYESHPVAIKVMLPERTIYATPECKAKFQREFIGASVEPSMMIIIELLGGGSLQKNLKSIYPMTLDLEQSISIALDISQVMEYLHANGIIHRDLKPDNLLLLQITRCELMAAYATAKNMRPSVDGFPEDLLPLLQSCLAEDAEDPEDRPEFEEITKTHTKILQNCCTTRISHAIASVNEMSEEEDHDLNNEEECAHAQAPSQQSAETISKQNHKTAKSIGYTERQCPDTKESKPRKKYSMLKCLLPCLCRCFGL